MSKPDKPDDRASSEEEAELRAYRRIVNALERGDVDELAAALLEDTDPSGLGLGIQGGQKKVTICRGSAPSTVNYGGTRRPPPHDKRRIPLRP